MIYGAILGDIIGSPYEFDRGNKSIEFDLFIRKSTYTDDSVMTIAVAEALMKTGVTASADDIRQEVIRSMQKWGRKYPHAGYGASFRYWLRDKRPRPYNSYGNGSAMRVSAAGWLYDTIEKTREAAKATADVTHNHPEGIKGAESVASVIFLARQGWDKEEIKDYIVKNFDYNFSRSCDEIRPTYHHVESCQETVPEAMTAFFEGDSFEGVIRLAVSLGGDCDTLTCIAGAMAEAYYGVSDELKEECVKRLPQEMVDVIKAFEKK